MSGHKLQYKVSNDGAPTVCRREGNGTEDDGKSHRQRETSTSARPHSALTDYVAAPRFSRLCASCPASTAADSVTSCFCLACHPPRAPFVHGTRLSPPARTQRQTYRTPPSDPLGAPELRRRAKTPPRQCSHTPRTSPPPAGAPPRRT